MVSLESEGPAWFCGYWTHSPGLDSTERRRGPTCCWWPEVTHLRWNWAGMSLQLKLPGVSQALTFFLPYSSENGLCLLFSSSPLTPAGSSTYHISARHWRHKAVGCGRILAHTLHTQEQSDSQTLVPSFPSSPGRELSFPDFVGSEISFLHCFSRLTCGLRMKFILWQLVTSCIFISFYSLTHWSSS